MPRQFSDPAQEVTWFRAKAQYLVHRFPTRVQVLYECPCEKDRKEKHHFDYARPYEVLLLCEKCHKAEHSRLHAADPETWPMGRLKTILDREPKELTEEEMEQRYSASLPSVIRIAALIKQIPDENLDEFEAFARHLAGF